LTSSARLKGTDKLVEEAPLISAPQRRGLGTAIPTKATP
jgi:hypothetical protein